MTSKLGADFVSAASPLPAPEIKTTLAPGKRGPVGMGGRTDYSRVNSGAPQVADAGASEQKSLAPDSAGMLQKAAASEGSMGSMAARPTLNEMVKSAMAGASRAASVGREAARQAASMGEKTASAAVEAAVAAAHTPVVADKVMAADKLASALDYVAAELRKEGAQLGGPYTLTEHRTAVGEGPGAIGVLESNVPGKDPIKPSTQGSAHTQVPKHTPEERSTPNGPATQMESNMAHAPGGPGHQTLSMVNQKHGSAEKCDKCGKEKEKCACGGKMASALRARFAKVAGIKSSSAESKETEGMAEAKAGLAKAEAAHKSEPENKKEAGFMGLAAALLPGVKVAEDAINPAQISAGAAVPPDTREAGQPGGVQAKGSGPGMVSSNMGAINYKKNQAKAEPKTDMGAYVKEPALTQSTDKTLEMAFKHTGEAGTKFAGAEGQNKTAAARALLSKLADAAEEKKNAAEKGK